MSRVDLRILGVVISIAAGCDKGADEPAPGVPRAVFDQADTSFAASLGEQLEFDDKRFGPFSPGDEISKEQLEKLFPSARIVFLNGTREWSITRSDSHRVLTLHVAANDNRLEWIECETLACRQRGGGPGVGADVKKLSAAFSDLACDFSQGKQTHQATCSPSAQSPIAYVVPLAAYSGDHTYAMKEIEAGNVSAIRWHARRE